MLDTAIRFVTNIIDETTFQVMVTHIGKHNQFRYNDIEIVYVSENKTGFSVDSLTGVKICCSVKYRDIYNRLNAKVQLVN